MPALAKKFLIKVMPDLSDYVAKSYIKSFLYKDELFEIFLEKFGDSVILKRSGGGNSDKQEQGFSITLKEFEFLHTKSIKELAYDYFHIEEKNLVIKIFKGAYSGMNTCEYYFDSENKVGNLVVPDWVGKEISNTPLGNEKELIQLQPSTFKDLFNLYNKQSAGVVHSKKDQDDSGANTNNTSQIETGFKNVSSIL